MNVTVEAPAKINLTLDVVGRPGRRVSSGRNRHAGRRSVRPGDGPPDGQAGCRLAPVRRRRVPDGPDNTAVRAAAAFFEACGLPNPGVEIELRKRIPLQAGLAGGSADAAGTLVALDRLMDTRMTAAELCAVAETVGADVPFCVLGAAAYAEGTGTILTPLPSLPDCAVVIAKPLDGVSTAEAYRLVDRAALTRRPHTGAAVDAVCAGDLAAVAHGLCNVFEEALALPEVARSGR